MRSRRNMLGRPSVLVDTTFLLPALGIEVEEEAMRVIPLFRKLRVRYLEVALLEALWKVLRIVDRSRLRRVKLGIEAIRNTYEVLVSPPEACLKAVKIYDEGHRDYIDALHYETARAVGIPWLTIDHAFLEFLENKGYPVGNVVITPRNLENIVANV